MSECKSVSASFCTLSILLYIAAFVLTLLTMIFSCVTPKKFITFK